MSDMLSAHQLVICLFSLFGKLGNMFGNVTRIGMGFWIIRFPFSSIMFKLKSLFR